MATPIRQESFAGGELSPRVSARTALAKYASGLRRSRNFFSTPEGAALNRSGWPLVREAKDSAAAVDRAARLIPFVYSESPDQAYVLEFGHHYIRFHASGGTIAQPLNPNAPLEVVTPYAAADLPRLKYSQVGNLMTLTLGGYDTMELVRVDHDEWTIGPLAFDVPTPSGSGYVDPTTLHAADDSHPKKQWTWQVTEVWEDADGVQWETAPYQVKQTRVVDGDPWHPSITYKAGWQAMYEGTLYEATAVSNEPGQVNKGVAPDTVIFGPLFWAEAEIAQIPPDEHFSPVPLEVVLYPDKTIWLIFPEPFGLQEAPVDGRQLVARRIYRGRGQDFGYVGEAEGSRFEDVGDLPDVTRTPPQGRNPLKVFNQDGTLVRTEQARVVSHIGERRALLGTAERPETVFCSRVGDYYNFDRHSPAVADDAFEVRLAGQLREEIRWARPMGTELVIGTQSSVRALGAPDGEVLGPGRYRAPTQSEAGASWLDPLVAPPDVLLYVRTKGTGVRDLVFDANRGSFAGSDLTLLVRHLFRGRKIVSWCFAEDPWSVAWLVRDDGKMLSLTYVREQEVWAWAWHDTGDHFNGNRDLVEDVCTIPEGTEDAVYLIVRRFVGAAWHRYIERMATRDVADAAEGIFLDSSITKRNLEAVDGVVTVTGLGHLEGRLVTALADGLVYEAQEVVDGKIELADEEGEGFDVVHAGLAYVSELELLDLVVQGANIKNQVKQVVRVLVEVDESRGLEIAERVDAPDEEWVEWDQRRVDHGYDAIPLETDTAEVSVFSSWNKRGRVAIRQRSPLPCTVLSVTREAELGGT